MEECCLSDIIDFGHFDIILNDYLKTNKVSKNYLAQKAVLQRTQLNNYCKNQIKRPDFDVLARICFALDCELSDIIHYVKPQKMEEKENGR